MKMNRLRVLSLGLAAVILMTFSFSSAAYSVAPVIPAGLAAVAQNVPAPGQHIVKSGDTLPAIASKNGITASEIKWANGLKSDIITAGQVLTIPARQDKPLKDIISEKGIIPGNNIEIVVNKTDHVLGILSTGILLKAYHVELGSNGSGDKQVEGDHKTPEGTFYVSETSVLNPPDQYLGTRWMRLSYPNIEDADRGLQNGLVDKETHDDIVTAFNNTEIPSQDTALGGGVGIHGGSTPELGSDWTWGCVGLTNKDVEDFYDFVSVGTKVTITH